MVRSTERAQDHEWNHFAEIMPPGWAMSDSIAVAAAAAVVRRRTASTGGRMERWENASSAP